MVGIKLQAGCLALLLYLTIVYIKGTYINKVECNKFFKAILIVAPWAIIFDGVTAITVNHRDVVPDSLNMIFHLLFFLFMNATVILLYIYMLGQVDSIKTQKALILRMIPGAIVQVLVIAFIWEIRYIPGNTTDYSMGISVVLSYSSLIVHFLLITIMLIAKRRLIARKKRVSILSFIGLLLVVLFLQVIFPEILITSIFPVISVLCLYINFEDPYMVRMKRYNESVIVGFASLVENRDSSTGGHIIRTKAYVELILEEMEKVPKYKAILTKDFIEYMKSAAPMHDIGKISTPDMILKKPAKLTPEEYEEMKKHSPNGGEMVTKLLSSFGEPDYQKLVHDVARYHHEKWNGNGYPDGLKGEEIPLSARIMAIADVFDAVSAKRCYRDAMPLDRCFEIIEDGAGTDFDPELAKLFVDSKEKVINLFNNSKFDE